VLVLKNLLWVAGLRLVTVSIFRYTNRYNLFIPHDAILLCGAMMVARDSRNTKQRRLQQTGTASNKPCNRLCMQ